MAHYPTPDELWNLTFAEQNAWRDRFAAVPFEDKGGSQAFIAFSAFPEDALVRVEPVSLRQRRRG
jgi:hypothetical protein